MNTIPLINNAPGINFSMNKTDRAGVRSAPVNDAQLRQEVNTSIVALKQEAFSLETLINKAAQELTNLNNRIAAIEQAEGDYVKKADVVDTVSSGNMNPVTSNAVDGAIIGNTPYNPFFNNYDTTFNIDTVGAGHKTYVRTVVGGGTSGTCPSDYGVVETIVGNNGDWKFQVAKGTDSDTTYTRQNINNGGWTAWIKVLNSNSGVNLVNHTVDYSSNTPQYDCNAYLIKNIEIFAPVTQFSNYPSEISAVGNSPLVAWFTSRGENLSHSDLAGQYRNIQEFTAIYHNGSAWVCSKWRRFSIDVTVFPWASVN